MFVFIWEEPNVEHIAGHGVTPDEAEFVVRHHKPPYPRKIGNGKLLVWGRTSEGRHLQVVFVYPEDERIDFESLDLSDLVALSEGNATAVYVVHAMELTDKMKRRFHKQ